MATASEIVRQAQAWLGRKESDNSHREIIDIYNAHKPLARGYKVTYWDAWCATFVSAVAIKCGATDIIPTECGCGPQIELFKKLGEWVEDDSYIPSPGDIIFYDWQDSGAGDNRGGSDHVGIVESVVSNAIVVIEGNYSDSVKRRYLSVNGRYIRGYGVPKYADEGAEKPKDNPPAESAAFTVKEWQLAAIADGYKFPVYGADGEWGTECVAVARKAVVKQRVAYTNRNLTKLVQRAVGVEVDGKCGRDTKTAIIAYQQAKGLIGDGAVGINTWKALLDIK
jgi:peptidoglycan hydrolase-like protein with peptidoglycan-binding domain